MWFVAEGLSIGQPVEVTAAALAAAAAWADPGAGMAPVGLLVDDTMLLVTQGDDRSAFDTDGSPASPEYLALAPLDRGAGHAEACEIIVDGIRWEDSGGKTRWEPGEAITLASDMRGRRGYTSVEVRNAG